jgi:murein DD-endopeptidase MepM/ murein hydrolase activator NlpD
MNIGTRKVYLIFPIILYIFLTYACSKHSVEQSLTIEADTFVDSAITETKYGLPVDSFDLKYSNIKLNQNISELLRNYNVSFQTIDILAKKAQHVINLKKIRRGNPYTLFFSKDTAENLQYLVYEHTPTEYVVFKVCFPSHVFKREKEITIMQKTTSGVIQTSLWQTMLDRNLNPLLANELSEIFAWSIDFFGLQKGDRFKVMYEEQYIDNISVGLGKIYAAYFNHAGEDFYAIPFIQDGKESFYDQDGNNLRKVFLKAPLRFSRISSGYSYSRMHPILKIRRPHLGVDYAAPYGTPVHAVGDGKIMKIGRNGDAGKMVKIKHNSLYTTAYLHLSQYGEGIKQGKYVKQGEIIGYVGSTGLSTGPHLDFRFYKNSHPIDPLKVKAPPVNPVKEENILKFNKIKKVIITLLNTIQ